LKGDHKHTRKNKKKTIGFLSDRRRINVGLSRAKYVCFVVGDVDWLSKFPTWGEIIEEAISQKQLYEYREDVKDYFRQFAQNRNQFLRTKI
jgi:superfamily I DNA and/or RNA helicase